MKKGNKNLHDIPAIKTAIEIRLNSVINNFNDVTPDEST